MSTNPPSVLGQWEFDPAALMLEHPPRFVHPNKRQVFGVSCGPGAVNAGRLVVTRLQAMDLPAAMPAWPLPEVILRESFYTYEQTVDLADADDWHVHFADPDLFCFYHSALFAQDEMQVAEHPILGAVREALLAAGDSTRTVERGEPTPILVAGAERRCAIAVDANAEAGRPNGLYGMRFAQASPETLARAVRPISPPTRTNLICVAAPSGGRGAYTSMELDYIVRTALTGFAGAQRTARNTVVHTGFWGCGAFGGDRTLMTLLQMTAAWIAGVGRVYFYTGNAAGTAVASEAVGRWKELIAASTTPDRLLLRVLAMGICWGRSDGN